MIIQEWEDRIRPVDPTSDDSINALLSLRSQYQAKSTDSRTQVN